MPIMIEGKEVNVYDCIPFLNETELLLMRMEILNDFVDYWVVSEGDVTFQGTPKPFNFEANKFLFKKWEHKIIYNKFHDKMGTQWNNWDRDKNHKNAIAKALEHCNDNDIILTSDCDEIPNFEKNNLLEIYNPNGLVHMMQNFYYYYLNYQKVEDWYGTKICSYKFFKERSFDIIRNMKSEGTKISNGGWHFSFLTDIEGIKTKVKSWGHSEYNIPFFLDHIEENVKAGRDIFYRGDSRFVKVPIDESYPEYIRNNLDKYSQFILK